MIDKPLEGMRKMSRPTSQQGDLMLTRHSRSKTDLTAKNEKRAASQTTYDRREIPMLRRFGRP